ncbi:2-oxoacid:ferredoxin oxidoreductase subunit gamma [candidate division WOR-3 bacterium]|nr:2-oxoacid:ferredoxin oxidoreductase subunit gamma [candidate division WOR-3 bacterium]
MSRTEVRLAGTGGQGVILASVILAEAAGVYEGRQVVQTQSYGPEARGGASKADVIIADEPVLFPKCRKLDVLVCLSQQAAERYFGDLKVRGVAIIDGFYVRECPRRDAWCLPLAETARRELGRELFTNILALGALARISGLVRPESLEQAVAARVPARSLDANRQALRLGRELAEVHLLQRRSSAPATAG